MDTILIAFIMNISFTVALLVFMGYTQFSMNKEREVWSKEREMLVKANMARDLTELSVSETMKKSSEEPDDENNEDTDLVAVEEADEKLFNELAGIKE